MRLHNISRNTNVIQQCDPCLDIKIALSWQCVNSFNGGVSWQNTKNTGLTDHLTQYIMGTPLLGPDVVAIGLQDNGSRVRQGNTSIFNQAS